MGEAKKETEKIDKKGSVLIISLWILAILVIFAIGLGRRAALNLKLVRYQKDRLKAYYLIRGGINKAISLSKQDLNDINTKDYDTLEECGIKLDGKEPKDFFSHSWNNGLEHFDIGYINPKGNFIYGMQDEESRLYINGTDEFSKNKIYILLSNLKVEDAKGLADIIINWIKPDSKIEIAKKEDFREVDELLLVLEYFYREVKGNSVKDALDKAHVTFAKIKDQITVFSDNKVNINTASSEVFKAIIFAVLPSEDGITESDAEGLLAAIQSFRTEGGAYFKTQDINTETIRDKLGLGDITSDGRTKIIDKLVSLGVFTAVSNNIRIEGIGTVNNISKKIIASYDRVNKKIVYGHEN